MSLRYNKNDPQALDLYKMEDGFMRAAMRATCSREQLQELANKACRRWRVPTVNVVFSRHAYWYGEYTGHDEKIRLFNAKNRKRPGGGRNPHVLLHEVAHHIDDYRGHTPHESHGASFAAICMDLFDHYDVIPKKAYRMLAKKHGVKIASGLHPPRRRKTK